MGTLIIKLGGHSYIDVPTLETFTAKEIAKKAGIYTIKGHEQFWIVVQKKLHGDGFNHFYLSEVNGVVSTDFNNGWESYEMIPLPDAKIKVEMQKNP